MPEVEGGPDAWLSLVCSLRPLSFESLLPRGDCWSSVDCTVRDWASRGWLRRRGVVDERVADDLGDKEGLLLCDGDP